jgi:adenylate cyclase
MHTIRFDGKTPGTAECERETALLAASTSASVPLPHRCGGHARCGTCLVTVVEGAEHLSEKGAAETRVLLALKANPDQRLACQTWAKGDVSVKY